MPAGIVKLLDILDLDASSTFCDLGSGIGRVVLSAAMASDAASCVGLELSDSRLEQAEAAAAVLSGLGTRLRPTRFVRADLGGCDLEAASGGASHYFMCSTAFGAALCRSLAERLAAAPSFRLLVTSRPLPPQQSLVKLGEVSGVEFSWIARGSLHVYVRDFAGAPRPALARFWCRDGVCAGPARVAPWRLGLVVEDEPLVAPAGGSGGLQLQLGQGGGDGSNGGRNEAA